MSQCGQSEALSIIYPIQVVRYKYLCAYNASENSKVRIRQDYKNLSCFKEIS